MLKKKMMRSQVDQDEAPQGEVGILVLPQHPSIGGWGLAPPPSYYFLLPLLL